VLPERLQKALGTDDAIVNAIGASLYHKSTVVNQDVNSGHLVVGALAARDYKGVGTQYVNENKVVVEPVLFENSRRDAARIAHDGISHTLQTHMGTGGGNVPMLAFDTQFGSNANVTEDIAPTLKSSQQSPSVAYCIQGNVIGRQDHNGPAGKGHTEDGDPMFTLTSTDIHAVAYPIDTRNALRDPEKYDAQNRQGLGIGNDGDPMATLTSAHVNGVAHDAPATMAVRRLTPLECERLMGWPDDHTLTKADGTIQADSHRYKQCGNGVASPVAQWIAKHILAI
jgi:site-specific DNA-cytosine methylase